MRTGSLLLVPALLAVACQGMGSGSKGPSVKYPKFFNPIVGFSNDIRLVNLYAGDLPGNLLASVQRNGNQLIDVEFEIGKRESMQHARFYQDVIQAETPQWDYEQVESMTEFLDHFDPDDQPDDVLAMLRLHELPEFAGFAEGSVVDFRLRVRYRAGADSPEKVFYGFNHAVLVGPESGKVSWQFVDSVTPLGVGDELDVKVVFSKEPLASYPVYFRALEVVEHSDPDLGTWTSTHETDSVSFQLAGTEVSMWQPEAGVTEQTFTVALDQAPGESDASSIVIKVDAGGWSGDSETVPIE